ncbi:UDP-N-acetylmuramate:L-alanyl-gamma-D-glutamyl-meso-diaminopimelate ligase [Thalassotalea mangrovi]|uniref:UDP-N-acetylmuramate--L-alanyl-gamma-D-glutamyl-meso-2,6-diaminoheptandioate ligase n=1 Tax=Thalassotalea mangrovi TaxID=2572245 RepID=A0A4U1BBM8_9GAMM|nr:UDP-N-acetylmuramate:L-alanyl-gamma-D-glutamyl-meso-diaminopimelate ligase [Thalassotalea mangrovi]TKB47831.1 UDP-N-acetylmuramate:L-alanyl-gamma-D-glutamyl-meso-diaminopimelate ligase [Thalassotalea mangrovi]
MSKHIHILGVCGTFMGGIAAIAKELGFRVSGSDANVYPPMSTQLQELGIELKSGYLPEHLSDEPDLVIVGNAMSRGNPMVEYVLERNIPYTSGPQWLLDNVLNQRWVLAVSGTHGKTTTSSMLAWILEYAKLTPGFLIGGVPQNFQTSARLGNAPFFVIEADEYDTAFFDKRSKFVHYRPHTLLINNLEFDHADIFDSIKDIQRQFHHLIRMVPGNGLILAPDNETYITETLNQGLWTRTEFSRSPQGWQANKINVDGSAFEVIFDGEKQGEVHWSLMGDFNIDNALMAIGAARHAGVPVAVSCEALASFVNTKRRQELLGTPNDIHVYDDFAHHPTAISNTLTALRSHIGNKRLIAVLEPRSNTMKAGIHKDTLAQAFTEADRVFIFKDSSFAWSVDDVCEQITKPASAHSDIDELLRAVSDYAESGDHIVVMSNGGFSGFHTKLLKTLEQLT